VRDRRKARRGQDQGALRSLIFYKSEHRARGKTPGTVLF
jgi:hypothetical protein